MPYSGVDLLSDAGRVSDPLLRLAGFKDGNTMSIVADCEKMQATVASRRAWMAHIVTGEDLMEPRRSLDGDVPARFIYHSHPNGRACLLQINPNGVGGRLFH